jgi:hypothetical protein
MSSRVADLCLRQPAAHTAVDAEQVAARRVLLHQYDVLLRGGKGRGALLKPRLPLALTRPPVRPFFSWTDRHPWRRVLLPRLETPRIT